MSQSLRRGHEQRATSSPLYFSHSMAFGAWTSREDLSGPMALLAVIVLRRRAAAHLQPSRHACWGENPS